MDKLTDYPKLIKTLLMAHVNRCQEHPDPNSETFLISDEAQGHYLWMTLGWQKGERFSGATVYVRLRDQKFWIEEDWTEEGIATELVAAGVPKEDIVLAFHEPQMRCETGFAVV
ncbi:MAG: XisI protein [Chroococcales cyanobacterium]